MNRTSISDLKLKAKDQLLGNYGIATGSFALLFVLIYSVMTVIMSALTAGITKGDPFIRNDTLLGQIEMQLISMVLSALIGIMTTGYSYIFMRIARGERPVISDLFHVFKNHPDKIIIISFIMTGIQFILLLPSTIVSFGGMMRDDPLQINGKGFLLWAVLYLAGYAVSFIIDLMLVMCFFIYLDDPEMNVCGIIKDSISMMRGNKFRYFYMLLSFLGYWLLVILSLGIAALWVVPYQTMASVVFYNDLRADQISVEEL